MSFGFRPIADIRRTAGLEVPNRPIADVRWAARYAGMTPIRLKSLMLRQKNARSPPGVSGHSCEEPERRPVAYIRNGDKIFSPEAEASCRTRSKWSAAKPRCARDADILSLVSPRSISRVAR